MFKNIFKRVDGKVYQFAQSSIHFRLSKISSYVVFIGEIKYEVIDSIETSFNNFLMR